MKAAEPGMAPRPTAEAVPPATAAPRSANAPVPLTPALSSQDIPTSDRDDPGKEVAGAGAGQSAEPSGAWTAASAPAKTMSTPTTTARPTPLSSGQIAQSDPSTASVARIAVLRAHPSPQEARSVQAMRTAIEAKRPEQPPPTASPVATCLGTADPICRGPSSPERRADQPAWVTEIVALGRQVVADRPRSAHAAYGIAGPIRG